MELLDCSKCFITSVGIRRSGKGRLPNEPFRVSNNLSRIPESYSPRHSRRTRVEGPTAVDIEAAQWLARECQVAAGVFLDDPDSLDALEATASALNAVPESLSALHMAPLVPAVVGLARLLAPWTGSSPTSLARSTTSRARVCAALDYLLAHHSQRLTLTQVAAHVGVNRTYLSAAVGKYSGRTFLESLHLIRAMHAAVALCDAEDTISAIGSRYGFRQSAHFVRQFSGIVKVTPARFRRLCRILGYPRTNAEQNRR
jgi:AraC-like DNA-binding protein